MIKTVEITIEPKTALADATRTRVKLCSGLLETVIVRSFPGVNGEGFLKIEYQTISIIPVEDDEWIRLDGEMLVLAPYFKQWQDDYLVDVYTCAPDARFPHTVIVTFIVNEQKTITEILTDFIRAGFK